jgi:hypothetical protein
MNKLIWKLLRQHISVGQLAGFFFANLFGMMIVLLSVQFYKDVIPVFTEGDSFMKEDYIIASKKVSTIGSFTGSTTTFDEAEIADMQRQPFTKKVGKFTSSQYKVSAGFGTAQAGTQLTTEMFFESVPDEFVDSSLRKWHYTIGSHVIPIIIPRTYLNLYNFGFAQARNMPKISEGVMGMVQMNIVIRSNDNKQVERFTGNIVGTSNRLNTILVPQAFMDWANKTYAPTSTPETSRLIVEVHNPGDGNIAKYFQQKNYDTEDGKLDAGKTAYFLRLIVGLVLVVGLLISILSFYILMLSIFLLLQKNTTKLETLLLIGFSPWKVAKPYILLTLILNICVLCFSVGLVAWLRTYYTSTIAMLFPNLHIGSLLPTLVSGIILFAVVSIINITAIRKKVNGIWMHKD